MRNFDWKRIRIFCIAIPTTLLVTVGFIYLCLFSVIKKQKPEFVDFEVLAFLSFAPFFYLLVMTATLKVGKWSIHKGDILESASSLIAAWTILVGLILDSVLDYTYIYRVYGLRDASTGLILNDGPTALYFTVVTWTTLGYGDFLPANQATRAVAAGEAVTGYLIMAVLVAALVAQFDAISPPHDGNNLER
jgi:Ion channel